MFSVEVELLTAVDNLELGITLGSTDPEAILLFNMDPIVALTTDDLLLDSTPVTGAITQTVAESAATTVIDLRSGNLNGTDANPADIQKKSNLRLNVLPVGTSRTIDDYSVNSLTLVFWR